MNKADYKEYEKQVAAFFDDNALRNLSPKYEDLGDGEHGDIVEPSFSWSACECCGSTLGGDKYEADGYSEKHGVMEFDTICVDCIYYAEYGKLDDMTMLDMQD